VITFCVYVIKVSVFGIKLCVSAIKLCVYVINSLRGLWVFKVVVRLDCGNGCVDIK
jgi:hypothetical protein